MGTLAKICGLISFLEEDRRFYGRTAAINALPLLRTCLLLSILFPTLSASAGTTDGENSVVWKGSAGLPKASRILQG